jgi:signal transduction histidine kinase
MDGPILVLAPIGRDGMEIGRVLRGIGASSRVLASLDDLCKALHSQAADAAALLIAEEAIADGTERLVACLADQPPWSDLPVMIMTAGGSRRGRGERWALFEGLGNVTLLDRPMHAETLQSAIRAALRARARQYQTRAHLEALRLAAETLEARVEERTRELMAAEEALRQTQKMEAMGQLTGGIAHDFNNLLQGICGSLELLRRRMAQGERDNLDHYITLALSSANRAAALTQRLLAFARRQTLDPKPTQVNQLIDGMQDLIGRTVGPEITLETVFADDLGPTLCDPHQLENALLNLCINARDAMPDGGRLTIVTASLVLDEQAGRDRAVPPGSYVSVGVTDTGTGMPPEVMARVFDPFFTTKPLGKGTGLGLSMVYGFARQSGGHVEIESEPGRGTTVMILLPQYTGELRGGLGSPEPASELPAMGAGTVLIVDDEPAIRAVITDLLTEMGYSVVEANDGAAGLAVLQRDQAIDLLITDVGLPNGLNGRQMADAARRTRPKLKVLFITGYAESAAVRVDDLEPGMRVLVKPFSMAALAREITVMVNGP